MVGLCDQVFADTESYQFERNWIEAVCGDIDRLMSRRQSGADIAVAVAALAAEYDGTTDMAE